MPRSIFGWALFAAFLVVVWFAYQRFVKPRV